MYTPMSMCLMYGLPIEEDMTKRDLQDKFKQPEVILPSWAPVNTLSPEEAQNLYQSAECLTIPKVEYTDIKLDYSLAPPEFDDVILVLQHSAETGKYGRNDWLEGRNFNTENSIASLQRHIRDYRLGLRNDRDNNLHPMLMVACRALMIYTLDKRGKKE